MSDLIMHHQVVLGMVLLWLFSAIVSGMPAPTEKDTRGYLWAYNSLHAFSANLSNLGNVNKVVGGQNDSQKTGN